MPGDTFGSRLRVFLARTGEAGGRLTFKDGYLRTPDGDYLITELSELGMATAERNSGVKLAVVCGGISFALSLPLAFTYRSVLILVAGALVAVGLVAGILIDARRKPRWAAITATYRGRTIVLFESADDREVRQVSRALIRMMEHREKP